MRDEVIAAIQNALARASKSSMPEAERVAILGHLFAARELATRADYGA